MTIPILLASLIGIYVLLKRLRNRDTGDSALLTLGKLTARCIVHLAAFVLALFEAADSMPRRVLANYRLNVELQFSAMPQLRSEEPTL